MAKVFEASLWVEGAAVGLMALGALALRRWARVLAAASAACFVATHFVMSAEMREIRLAHGGTLEKLAPDDSDRARFGKLHGLYNATAIAVLALGVCGLVSHARRKD
jgi:hypothetical protein